MQELLALEERIGNVNTGLADEKISGCMMEVACCSSARLQNDKENASCVICLVRRKFHITLPTAGWLLQVQSSLILLFFK
jgi:hypothetical protein